MKSPRRIYAEKQAERVLRQHGPLSGPFLAKWLVLLGVGKSMATRTRRYLADAGRIIPSKKVQVTKRGQLVRLWELSN